MSKFFFKGRIDAREKYQRFGYNTKREIKLGTANSPLTLMVPSETRKKAVLAILAEHSLFATILVDAEQAEDLLELNTLLNKPVTQCFDQTPSRNEPCHCGSAKKYKKCCG